MGHRFLGVGFAAAAIILGYSACEAGSRSRQSSESSGVSSENMDPPADGRREPYADTIAIMQRVDSINTLLEQKRGRFEMFARTYNGGDVLVRVHDPDAWPEDTEVSLNILRDDAGSVLYHWESPTSESGDWNKSIAYYFDPQGRTILRVYFFGSFSPCENSDVVRSTIRTFVNPATGKVVAETEAVTDADDQAFRNPDACVGTGRLEAPKRSIEDLSMPSNARTR